ncbi:MAG: polysaccharide deacetylase family protein [Bacteroidota bacterium]
MNNWICIGAIFLLSSRLSAQGIKDSHGALIRSDTLSPFIYLCFTGHDFHEGFEHVMEVLEKHHIEASFFLTGDFVRNHEGLTKRISEKGHFIGAHSDKHLLYCDWTNRDSLLHPSEQIKADIEINLRALARLKIYPMYFMPPYEWYNNQVVEIAQGLNQQTINFSPGTRSNADYTTPDMSNYVSSKEILESIYTYERNQGMAGFHLLIHPGTSPLRTDKLYAYMDRLLVYLKDKGYQFRRFN